MPTAIAAGSSPTITLPAGQRLMFYAGGQGLAVIMRPGATGPQSERPVGTQPVTIGPFTTDRLISITCDRDLTYAIQTPPLSDYRSDGSVVARQDTPGGQLNVGSQGVAGLPDAVLAGNVATDTLVAWTPASLLPGRLWYSAEDALTAAGALAVGTGATTGDAVQTIPNRFSTVSRTDSQPMPLVARTTALGAGSAANRPTKRTGNALNGYQPVSFGTVVSGGTTNRLATQLGAMSPIGVHRIFLVAAARGTNFPYLMAWSNTAGNSVLRGGNARNFQVGTDSQGAGSFTDSAQFLFTFERPGTEALFDNAVAASSVIGRLSGSRIANNTTAATSQESSNVGFVIGNRGDTDVATDIDFWEVVVCEGKMTQADIYRTEGYLAHKYGLQATLPGDHPHRSSPPLMPVNASAPGWDLSAYAWGMQQYCYGYQVELADDNIAANDGAQGSDQSRSILYDLKPAERARLATLLQGAYGLRFALGIYYRGSRSINGGSGLSDGIGPRLPGQRQRLYELMKAAGMVGIIPEYWSPAPDHKTTSDFPLGTLWAGGAYSRATTLDSIRTTGPTVTAVTKASPGVVTYSGTDPAANSLVYIAGVGGMTQLNARFFRIASLNTGTKTFALTDSVTGANVDTTAYGTFTSGGTLGFDYAAQMDRVTSSKVADMEDLHSHDTFPMPVRGYAPQNEPSASPAAYGSCTYNATLYLDELKSIIPKIRNSAKLSSFGGLPNTVAIIPNSLDGPGGAFFNAIVADTVVLSTGKTVLQEIAYTTHHRITEQNADPNSTLTTAGTAADGQPFTSFRQAATNPTGIAVANNEYEFFSALGRPQQFANLVTTWLNHLNWMKAPIITLIHALKPSTDPVTERYALGSWRVPGDNGAVATSYASGLDYGEFAIHDVNYNAARPFIRMLKGATWLPAIPQTYNPNQTAGGFYRADGKLVVILHNAGASAVTMSVSIGPVVRTMRGMVYSATQRDQYLSDGSVRSNRITSTVEGRSTQFWVEA